MVRNLLAALTLLVPLVACGSGTGPTPPPPPPPPPPVLQRIEISGLPASWTVGQTTNLTATAVFSSGPSQNVTASATWSSSDSAVATVSGGTVTCLRAGNTIIRASSQGITSSDVNLQVSASPATTFTLSGTVREGSATPIPNATVLIVDGANANKSTTTDNAGLYRLLSLVPGTFKVRATASGFEVSELNVTVGNSDAVRDFELTRPAQNPTANPGGPYDTRHDMNVTFDGLSSRAQGSATIVQYEWNCGQAQYGSGCDKTGARPVFNYRKCGTANRAACDSGNGGPGSVKTYTVTLKVTDSNGRTHTAQTTVRVTNFY